MRVIARPHSCRSTRGIHLGQRFIISIVASATAAAVAAAAADFGGIPTCTSPS